MTEQERYARVVLIIAFMLAGFTWIIISTIMIYHSLHLLVLVGWVVYGIMFSCGYYWTKEAK